MFNFREVMNQNVTTFLWRTLTNHCVNSFYNIKKFYAQPRKPLVIFHLAQKIRNLMQYPLLNIFSKKTGELTACGSLLRSLFAGPRFSPHVQAAYCSNTFHSNCLANHSLSTKIRNSFALKIY